MPSRKRVDVAGGIYHVVNNGHPGLLLFTDDRDRRKFLALLVEVQARFGCEVLTYCVLGTHFHLLIKTGDAGVAKVMHWLDGEYAKWWRWRHGPDGYVFKRRYFSVLVRTPEHLRNCAGYIALNPVKAGLASAPGEWGWSAHATIARGGSDAFVSPALLLEAFGGSRNYVDFVGGFDAGRYPDHDPRTLRTSRPLLTELLDRHVLDEAMILARHEYGYRVREIAEATGLSEATVSRRTRR